MDKRQSRKTKAKGNQATSCVGGSRDTVKKAWGFFEKGP